MKKPQHPGDNAAQAAGAVDKRETAVAFFLAHRNHLKGVAMAHVSLPHLPDEILQQVFVMFVSNAEKYDFNGNVKGFLSLITENIAKEVWRKESRHFPAKLQDIAELVCRHDESDEEENDYSETLDMLHQCLEKAPAKTADLVRKHYLEEVPVAEIAKQTGLKPDAIYQAIYRLREKLKQCIDRAAEGGPVYV